MNIWSPDFWQGATNTKSKLYLYRVTLSGKTLNVRLLEANAATPISEITRTLRGLPHGVVPCDEGKLRARELAMEDFLIQVVEKANE